MTWKCGDVDNDGKITIMDAVQLTKYLNGMVELVDYTKADLNADCIVDIVDSKIMDMYLGEKISSLPYTRYGGGSQYVTVGAQSVNELRNYTVFDAKTGESVDGYYLDSNSITDNSRLVIGEDTRYRDDSLPGVVKIIKADGTFGTGFVVDAHTIATAAHCVFSMDFGKFNNSKKSISRILIIDNNGNVCEEITDACEVHVPNKFISYFNSTTVDPDAYKYYASQYDYALITIPKDLSEYACFDLGIMNDGMISDSRKIYSTGYPKNVEGVDGNVNNSYTEHARYTGEGFVIDGSSSLKSPERNFCYSIDSITGNSGGPVYVKTDVGNTTYYTVIGIHNRNVEEEISNGGTRMTTELLQFYKNNPYLMY